jgi:hypothetical protein
MHAGTPSPVAIFENVDGQATIKQAGACVFIGCGDLLELIRRLNALADELGCERPELPRPLALLPGGRNGRGERND